MNCNSKLNVAMTILMVIAFTAAAQMTGPSASEGGRGLTNTLSAQTLERGFVGVNFNGYYSQASLTAAQVRQYSWVASSSLTYALTDELELSGLLYGVGRGTLHADRLQRDAFDSGLGAAALSIKFRLPVPAGAFDVGGRAALIIPMEQSFAPYPSYPYDTNQWGMELKALQTWRLKPDVRWHFNQGYRWQGLRDDHRTPDDLVQFATGLDYDLSQRWLGFNELASSIELDDKIQPLRDRLTLTQGLQYQTPWNMGVSLAASLGLSQKRWDDSPRRSEKWQVVLGASFGARTYRPDDDHDGIPNLTDLDPFTPSGWPVDSKGRPLDSDLDGVPDGNDKEPFTPKGALVDKFGRAIDSDMDGIADGIDKQPYSPVGAIVDNQGRAVDSDGDGVPDGIDQEQNSFLGAVVDARGVAFDSDADGVPDGIDLEPGTPKGMLVDVKGRALPPMEIELLTQGLLRVHRIYFDSGRASIKPESREILREIGRILQKYADLQIQIAGHADAAGTDEQNELLSQLRAESVRNYLLDHFPGIGPAMLSTVGHGGRMPVADNATVDGRTMNRRVEFVVTNRDHLLAAREQAAR